MVIYFIIIIIVIVFIIVVLVIIINVVLTLVLSLFVVAFNRCHKYVNYPLITVHNSSQHLSVKVSGLICNIIFVPRHVGILEITENKLFKITKVKLKTVRPFYMEDVVLKDTNIDPTQEDVMMAFLVDKVGVNFSQAYRAPRFMILST